jgi:hypothetical protein
MHAAALHRRNVSLSSVPPPGALYMGWWAHENTIQPGIERYTDPEEADVVRQKLQLGSAGMSSSPAAYLVLCEESGRPLLSPGKD